MPGAPDPPTRRLLVTPVYLHGCSCGIGSHLGPIWCHLVVRGRAGAGVGVVGGSDSGASALVLMHVCWFLMHVC